jgi:2-polyprenyl-3-methyl-5-hydroxy-6-metoxy-1,4-benzoquinol methylase
MQTSKSKDQSDIQRITKMVEPFKRQRFTRFPGPLILKLLTGVTPNTPSDLNDFADPIISSITLHPDFVALLKNINELDYSEIINKFQNVIFQQSSDVSIVHLIFRKQINTDALMEQALISLRGAYLRYVFCQSIQIRPEHLQIMLTIAFQCFNNEYVFRQTPEEEDICAKLLDEIKQNNSDESLFIIKVVAYAMYNSINTLPLSDRQVSTFMQYNQYTHELIDSQINNYMMEKHIALKIPSFCQIYNEVSTKVRRQYEESPYPRWVDFMFPKARKFNFYIKSNFPFLDDVLLPEPFNCLVAGCGTGYHALDVATEFLDVSVTAVDLSRSSLAYAARQASRYGISNIEFLHGDILQINALKVQFDLIEAVGVLHHMEDTFGGLKALTEALRPGGFMRVGVYSRSFRNRLKPAKELVLASLKSFGPSELRSMRNEIIAADSKAIAFSRLASDFYYLSGFRDLLCHVHEYSFAPLEVNEMLRKLELSFLGFNYADDSDLKAAFLSDYPHENSSRDLSLWEEFEASKPELMPSLLDFWVRKPF